MPSEIVRPDAFRSTLKRVELVTPLILALLFLLLSVAAAFQILHPLDVRISAWTQSLKTPWLTEAAYGISWFGEMPQGYIILILSAGVLFFAHRRREAVIGFASSVCGIVLDELFKLLVRSPGPFAPTSRALMTATDYTFPSGHVIFYMTFFGFLAYLVATRTKRSPLRTVLLFVLGILLVCVGFARVYLLQHWPSDVVGGYLLGGFILLLSIRIDRRAVRSALRES